MPVCEKKIYSIKPPTLISYMYIWSVLFEPLGYFVLYRIGSVNITISRSLQLLVLSSLILFFINSKKKSFYLDRIDQGFIKYFLIFCLCYVFSFINVEVIQNLIDENRVKIMFDGYEIVSPASRAAIIILSSFYKLIYFIILFRYLVGDVYLQRKFLFLFKKMFFVVMTLGFIDYLSIILDFGYIFSRHIHEDVSVGARFHGVFGEPRHVLPYLTLVAVISLLIRNFELKLVTSIWWILILTALFLTGSFSSVVAVFLAVISIIIYQKRYIYILILFPVLLFFYYASNEFNPHVAYYTNHFYELFDRLINTSFSDFNYELVGSFGGQDRDIYTLLKRVYEIPSLSGILNLLLGTGIMSAAVDYNYAIGNNIFDMSPPSSWFIVLFYEIGLLGLFLFIYSLYRPIWRFLPDGCGRLHAKELLIFITVICMIQKSDMIYIFIGFLWSFYAIKPAR